jgi:hypothetical protein
MSRPVGKEDPCPGSARSCREVAPWFGFSHPTPLRCVFMATGMGWDEATAVDLARVGDFWEGQIDGLVAGGEYELLVGRGAALVNHRLDPAAREHPELKLG